MNEGKHGIVLDKLVTTKDLVEMVRLLNTKENLPDSNYYIAKMLQVSNSTIADYISGKHVMSDEVALKVCDLLGWGRMDREIVLGCVALESARRANKDMASEFWEGFLDGRIA